MTNNLCVCDSVIVWPFWVCKAKCVIVSMFKYRSLSSKYNTDIKQCNTSDFFLIYLFLWFILTFFVSVGSSQFLNLNPDHVENKFEWCMWGNLAILILFHGATIYFKMYILWVIWLRFGFRVSSLLTTLCQGSRSKASREKSPRPWAPSLFYYKTR